MKVSLVEHGICKPNIQRWSYQSLRIYPCRRCHPWSAPVLAEGTTTDYTDELPSRAFVERRTPEITRLRPSDFDVRKRAIRNSRAFLCSCTAVGELGRMNAEVFTDIQLHSVDFREKPRNRSVIIGRIRFHFSQVRHLSLKVRNSAQRYV